MFAKPVAPRVGSLVSGPYRQLPEPLPDARLAPFLVGTALVALALRAVDLLFLVVRPRMFVAYLALLGAHIRRAPNLASRFSDLHEARRASKSALELTYGETPVVTAWHLLGRAGVTRASHVVDLGAGRGRVLFAVRARGAHGFGVELLSAHVDAARPSLRAIGAELLQGDATELDLGNATHVFVAWTCFSEWSRRRVLGKLLALRDGARVIALNWPVDIEGFTVIARGRALCTWGPVPYAISERRRVSG